MSKAVLDVFAPLTLLNQEDGAEHVVPLLAETAISTVNLAEVTARLALAGMPEAAIRETPEPVPFDDEQAVQVGLFAPETKVSGCHWAIEPVSRLRQASGCDRHHGRSRVDGH